MRALPRILALLVVGAAAAALLADVRIGSRGARAHLAAAGVDRAVEQGWGWVRQHGPSAVRRALEGLEGAFDHAAAVTASAIEVAVRVARAAWGGEDATERRSEAARPAPTQPARANPPREPASPPRESAERARARVARLEAASRAPPAPPPADKLRTAVDRPIRPEERAALDAKLDARRAE